ncbi:MAG: RNA methyltransferase [Halobacteriovoraceae bacterium]|nr:RNA methyltransferase [Halobacteriovoraceae bacterium]
MNRIPVVNKKYCQTGDIVDIREELVVQHLNNILKPHMGDNLKGFQIGGDLLEFELIDLTKKNAKVRIIKTIKSIPRYEIDFAIGVSRPQTMKKIIEHLSACGIKRIIVFKAELSEKSYLQSKIFDQSQMNHLSLLGMCQSGQFTTLPEIIIKENVHAYMKWDFDNPAQKFLLSLNSRKMLNNTGINFKRKMRFVFGPERGLTTDEEEYFLQNDYEDLKLSNIILRVENAVISLMGQIELMKTIKQKPDEIL